MRLDIYQVDAFADRIFEGNPAAVCPLPEWLPDAVMQNIAMENNLSETAFFVREGEQYRLRWFTPAAEVDLCGHATLASAHVLFAHRGYAQRSVTFNSNSGPLTVRRGANGNAYVMDFPVEELHPAKPPAALSKGLGRFSFEACYRADDYLLVAEEEALVRACDPDFGRLARIDTRGVIITAPAADDSLDFVSRFFAPSVGVNEDPVTGSAHTMLAPYWARRLGKNKLRARQVSKRGGNLMCRLCNDDRVEISGRACTFMEGDIEIA